METPQPEDHTTPAPIDYTPMLPAAIHPASMYATPAEQTPPAQPSAKKRGIWRPRNFLIMGAAAAALAVACTSVGVTWSTGTALALKAASSNSVVDGSSSASGTTGGASGGTSTIPGSGGRGGYAFGGGSSSGTNGTGGSSDGTGGSTSTTQAATAATDQQGAGVVLIDTKLAYESAEAAGTGIILTSDGEILTNNHVIEGATSITVTIASTGTTYTATVVGTDATNDVAVLKLDGASGLTTAKVDTSQSLKAGDAITGVGNAGGTGTLSAAAGTVTALNQTVTTQAEGSSAGETLDGMIQIAADIQAGDSGGPLYDAQGEVVGIDTAASSGSTTVTGFAIPITTALSIAQTIQSGTETDTVSIGYPAFLGIEVGSASTSTNGLGTGRRGSSSSGGTSTSTVAGALVAGVIDGTPAATAGLVAGDTITAVDGTAIASGTALTSTLQGYNPGDSVKITYTDAAGTSQSVTVTLMQGPAA